MVGLINSIRKRDKMNYLYDFTGKTLQAAFQSNFETSVFFKHIINSLLGQAKADNYNDKIVSAAGDVRKFWSVVNKMSEHPIGKDTFLARNLLP